MVGSDPALGGGAEDGSEPRLLEVGAVAKPHGLRGDVIVTLSTNREERIAPGAHLTTGGGRELVVVRSSPHGGRFIVAFQGVSDIAEAEALRGASLSALPLHDPDTLWIHDLIGSVVVDVEGEPLGTVEAVQANPASDLLVLGDGTLVPLGFVVRSEPGVRVVVDLPDGLLDLN